MNAKSKKPAQSAGAMPPEDRPQSSVNSTGGGLFVALFGALLGLLLLKFANPPIMEKHTSPPQDFWDFALGQTWPLRWAYTLLAGVAIVGLFHWKKISNLKLGLKLLPIAWLLWQVMVSTSTTSSEATQATLPHFAASIACFYLGLFVLGKFQNPHGFWVGIAIGLVLAIAAGWHQHFGGLEETRQYFWKEIYPTLQNVPHEYIKKITSNRVFGTLFYPNTLAAALILLLPVTGAVIFRWSRLRFTLAARLFLTCAFLFSGLACLYWSGSKGGWLVMLFVIALGCLTWPAGKGSSSESPLSKLWLKLMKARVLIVCIMAAAGLAGFFWTYSAFFKRGAPSVGARFDYWQGALKATAARPIFGYGPGAFAVPYSQFKAPESEMARLAHNDYLQQASDSGLPGFALYVAFVFGALWAAQKSARLVGSLSLEDRLVRFTAWLGLCGWAVHSFLEFNLYVPAIAWTAYSILGWLCAQSSGIGSTAPSAGTGADQPCSAR